MEEVNHYPLHIKHLLSDLKSSPDILGVLNSYIPCLSGDSTLYFIFLSLGYSPETGNFSRVPSVQEAVTSIENEYKDPLSADFSNLPNLSNPPSYSNSVKQEFLRTFYQNGIQELSEALSIGLEEPQRPREFQVPEPPLSATPQRIPETSRNNRGLRTLSLKVKEIICSQGFSSYKEVAEQLVKTMELGEDEERTKEEKNVLRRVYDALNVLIASGVVVKQNKRYYWKGTSYSDKKQVKETIQEKKKTLNDKREQLKLLADQYFSVREMFKRNKRHPTDEVIGMPFIVVATEENSENKVNIEFNKAHTDVVLKFSKEIKLFGDMDVLVKMGLARSALKGTEVPLELLELLRYNQPQKRIQKLF